MVILWLLWQFAAHCPSCMLTFELEQPLILKLLLLFLVFHLADNYSYIYSLSYFSLHVLRNDFTLDK